MMMSIQDDETASLGGVEVQSSINNSYYAVTWKNFAEMLEKQFYYGKGNMGYP